MTKHFDLLFGHNVTGPFAITGHHEY